MGFIDFVTGLGARGQVSGDTSPAGGRLNVSARADERIYYVSRDESEAYTLVYRDADINAGQYAVYLKNDHTTKHLVLHSAGVNSEDANGTYELLEVTGTATAGTAATPACLNRAAPKIAAVTANAHANSSANPIATLTAGVILDRLTIGTAFGHEEFRIQDSIRLGQGDAVAIRPSVGTDANILAGVIFFYFE